MELVLAEIKDAPIIHKVMIQAFQEYERATPPSNALSETVESIEQAMRAGEQTFIGYMEQQPVAMVRFTLSTQSIYFFRLSVIPERQGQGLAKALIAKLEQYALMKGKKISQCKVRWNVPRNIELYRSLGYVVTKKEMGENRNGISLATVTMEKRLSN
ncbi:N-acetyltransferase [Lysinibacillus sp. ZYM-1]|uniref:GNAT family N-acetyltransferase n=1 Tax=Lysinibacillus sp. ZYM-1 TaxID=1681184 RepID=UPI0006CEA230|nr:GNAT family N-acetyltransferase [Lysinibacillus sp. ZYM-1]KPN95897.1 GNAT family acetyltransferase [Lysinibacillus sp. ZYM-1]